MKKTPVELPIQTLLDALKDNNSFFLAGHQNPDGDTIGCMLCMASVLRRLGKGDYRDRKVLVIGGSSEEQIDDMRVITNRGTGETAVELARAAYERGARRHEAAWQRFLFLSRARR